MALNIKNSEAHELATELARLTGKSLTAVVIDAMRQYLEQLKRKQAAANRIRELMVIGDRIAMHLQQPGKSTEHGDLLYDERGLPK